MTIYKEGSKLKFAEQQVHNIKPTSSEEFVTWLTGFVEAIGDGHPTETQWRIIVNKARQIK